MSDLKKGLGLSKPTMKAPALAKTPGMPKDASKPAGSQMPVQQVSPNIGMSTKMANPMKVGGQATAVKTPKPKSMAQPTDKPSKFFKNEESKIKGVSKLNAFLNRKK